MSKNFNQNTPNFQVKVEIATEVIVETQAESEAQSAPEGRINLVTRESFFDFQNKGFERRYPTRAAAVAFWDELFGDYERERDNFPQVDYIDQGRDSEADWQTEFARMSSEQERASCAKNPNVSYLTTDSCEKILKHCEQFASGIDFQHLPRGFFLTKNPVPGGICNVLHFSEHHAKYQAADEDEVLAITLETQDALMEKAPDDSEAPFTGEQAKWYAFLQSKRVSPSGEVYCTEAQLQQAFIHFSNQMQVLGVQFDDPYARYKKHMQAFNIAFDKPQFSPALGSKSVNPIVLLGRWATVMNNPQLKAVDRQYQWQELLNLPLASSKEAIRAITDYAQTTRPCGFVRSDMQLDRTGFIAGNQGVIVYKYHTSEYSPEHSWTMTGIKTFGFQGEYDYASIGLVDKEDNNYQWLSSYDSVHYSFWRYLAYQPKRNSLEFYEKAIQRLDEARRAYPEAVNGVVYFRMLKILAYNTTNRNHLSDTPEEEKAEYQVWDAVCSKLGTAILDGAMLDIIGKGTYTHGLIGRLDDRISGKCNLSLMRTALNFENALGDIVISKVPLYLVGFGDFKCLRGGYHFLDDSLSNLMYEGTRFYLVEDQWKKLSVSEYLYLMFNCYKAAGGKETYETLLAENGPQPLPTTKDFPQSLTVLSSHMSTFNLATVDEFKLVLNAWPKSEASEQVVFCLDYLKDIQSNQNLKPETLRKLIFDVSQIRGNNWQLKVVEHLESVFSQHFKAGYFAEKKKEIIEASTGLTDGQLNQLKSFAFSNESRKAIAALESEIVKLHIPDTHHYLERLHQLLLTLKNALTAEDFLTLTTSFEDMRESIAKDHAMLPDFLELLIKKRSIESFHQVRIRNEIVQSKENLINKFSVFVEHIAPMLREYKELKLNRLALQEMAATVILNVAPESWVNIKLFKVKLHARINQLNAVSATHPHTAHYMLESINHLKVENAANYFEELKRLVLTLTWLKDTLPATGEAAKANMQVIYSLLANYHLKPTKLTEVYHVVHKLDSTQHAFMLQFLSRQLDNRQSPEGLETLIDALQEKEAFTRFSTLCKTPPYPNIKTLVSWLEDPQTIEEKYATFNKAPYGTRHIKAAFNHRYYQQQRSKFVGLDDVFTDDVGKALDKNLTAYRELSIETLLEAHQKLRDRAALAPLNNADKLELACVCIEVMARTASQTSRGKKKHIISQEFNTTQVMVLYGKLVHPGNRLISQIDTGEGKSRLMMALAACKATEGYAVDSLTSDMPLAERDYLTYKQYFTALDIPTSLITLSTPPELYQTKGVNFTDNSQLLLQRNRSDIVLTPHDYLHEDAKKRCLLVDEVDKFLHDKSTNAHNYANLSKELLGFTWVYPQLVQYVQSLKLEASDTFNPEEHLDKFIHHINTHVVNNMHKVSIAGLRQDKPKQLSVWLHSAYTALLMQADKHYVLSSADKDQLYLVRDTEGNARYSRKVFVLDNGRPVLDSTFSHGVHQCICAKENMALRDGVQKKDAFVITPENEILRSSFPVNFIAKYAEGAVYGVSGTTRSQGPVTRKDINYQNYTYLTMPRERPLKREDLPTWAAKDEEQQIAFLKRAILKRPNAPYLIVCKDDAQSMRIDEALQKDADFVEKLQAQQQRIYALTPKAEEIKALSVAGKPEMMTTSTEGMVGRGVDIDDESEKEEFTALCLYVPTEEDLIQIRGRAGRFGKRGFSQMIINLADEDYPLNGATYNIQNEVVCSQNKRRLKQLYQEETSALYAFFQESVTEQFVQDLEGCPQANRVSQLIAWQKYLGDIQKDWEGIRETLLKAVETQDKHTFTTQFNAFTEKWLGADKMPNIRLKKAEEQSEQINKVYSALMAQQALWFKPERQPILVKKDYDPSDDGQARIYSTPFARLRATLRGERAIGADFIAWYEGRGSAFPDLMAILNGEKHIFANLYTIITRWIEELTQWLQGSETLQEGAAMLPPLSEDEGEYYMPLNLGTGGSPAA